MPQLSEIRIVLINTFAAGNIGSVARAMKTMGLSQLCLVQPQDFPSAEADTLAVGAKDLLDQALVVDSLEEAIRDCRLVIGTSARSRNLPWPLISAHECGQLISEQRPDNVPIAIVFGRETMGLHNSELQQCHYHAFIPCASEFKSLNLASAVQIFAYEIHQGLVNASQSDSLQLKSQDSPACSNEEMELFFEHLQQTLLDINFIVRQHPGKIMTKLRRLFTRAHPEQHEMNILRGILSTTQRSCQAKTNTEEK